jgi:hypothetical protein
MADISNNIKNIPCTGDGGLSVKAGRVIDDCGNWLGQPFPQGPKGETGDRGPQGIQGPTGPVGPAPQHEWFGTKLRVMNGNGTWGPFVEFGRAITDFKVETYNLSFTSNGTYTYYLSNYLGGRNSGLMMAFSKGSYVTYRYGGGYTTTGGYFTSEWSGATLSLGVTGAYAGGSWQGSSTQYLSLVIMTWNDPTK